MFVYIGDKHISTYRFTKLPSEKAITDKNMFASLNNGNKSTKWVLNRTIKTYLELSIELGCSSQNGWNFGWLFSIDW